MPKPKSSDARVSGRGSMGGGGGFAAGVQHQPFLGAVVDIGATGVRLAIGEVDGFGRLRLLDSLAMPVSLGVDTFVLGRIERKTMHAAVRALRVYRQKIAEYKIDLGAHVRVVATSAVREARNRLEFIDHVYNLTGLAVEPFDEADVHRVTYLEVLRVMEQHESLGAGLTCVVEIGGGSTEILLLEDGDVMFANTFRLGSLRMRRTLDAYRTPGDRVREIMEAEVARVGDRLERALAGRQPDRLLVMGGDVRLAAKLVQPQQQTDGLGKVVLEPLRQLFESVWSTSVDQLVASYRLSIADAESLAPALLGYTHLANRLGQTELWVADTNLREGLLLDMAASGRSAKIRPQIIRSVEAVAAKYAVDLQHAEQVSRLAEQLLNDLAAEFGLTENCALILQVAAWLHEVGMYVNHRSYHKHSLYLIRSSEFFGINARVLQLAALVARYHRRASPQPQHEIYSTLDRRDRATVCKLAGILRVAKALDVARQNRVQAFSAARVGQRLVLTVPGVTDLTLEDLELRQSGSLFEETFGLRVFLATEDRLTA